MTVLSIVQEHCRRTKLPVPNTVASSTDVQVRQLFSMMNEMLEDLVLRRVWQQNSVEKTHTTLAAEDQGDITTLCPGFARIIPDSFFNRSGNLRVYFGLTHEEWQARKVVGGVSGPSYWARLRQNKLLVNPAPPAGQTWAWEYQSEYFVKDADTAALKETFTKDGDTFILSDRIGTAWLRWKWKHEKGLDYAEEFAKYESHIEALSRRDNGPQVLNMGCASDQPAAGVVVPIGNWAL